VYGINTFEKTILGMINIFWFRRDLRLEDNAGLYHALKSGLPVLPLFIFDKDILGNLEDRTDARLSFIHQTIGELHEALQGLGSSIIVKYGKPEEIWKTLLQEYQIANVYTNRDYEPYAQQRDANVKTFLAAHQIGFHDFKDHIIFEKDEVLKSDGTPYTVFTPYSRKWRAKLATQMITEEGGQSYSYYFQSYPTVKYLQNFHKTAPLPLIDLSTMNFEMSAISIPSKVVAKGIIRKYDETRDFPGNEKSTSKLGIHFRFGTISIREKARNAQLLNETYLNELIWRDFYSMILASFPHVVKNSFREKYDKIPWRDSETDLEKWKKGQTGYPIVDAGMRELNATGYMHNRVRMITASFLTKHLLLDWRLGEAYFAQKLLDFDLASNNGGWQWASGGGTDAAPYFRIFNPTSQMKKFDKDFKYIRKWVPELESFKYPKPMVDHALARERCLKTYKDALS
jgi:deoxyribodipyrimidine photo-lyase